VTPTRALIERLRGGPVWRNVLDTGERWHRRINDEERGFSVATSYTLALVHVEGEAQPWWIAVERLEGFDELSEAPRAEPRKSTAKRPPVRFYGATTRRRGPKTFRDRWEAQHAE
jgi:hypothetical protein